ncbi:hypothetical protein SLEP1_g59431 [Rubroshorea leprosula]|uniref:non-specific serine/threonine protein kinase n=1 Tax=Rubroshorea leprosula TaxID=152421 RepID=A0AAV5MSD1_9ROSI|nr:hypothetical protein SLEP1_g59431 [Rubroshorea leprosula]
MDLVIVLYRSDVDYEGTSRTCILYQFLFSLRSPDQPLLEIHPSIPPVPRPHWFNNMNYFLLFVVILLVLSETPLSSSNPEWYRICGNQFECGNVSAGFPFWGGDRRLPNCGHPKLQLKCEKNETAILEIVRVRYRVLEINQRDKKQKIAREDYEGGICPQNIQNIQNTYLDATLFVSAPDYVNITLLYGCPSAFNPPPPKFNPKSPIHEPLNFECDPKSLYEDNPTMGFILPGDTGPMGCSASATVLVRDDFYFSIEKIKQALKDGFEVEWKVDDEGYCQTCNASKGKCGINPVNETETVCYCQEPSSSSKECLRLPHDGK